jgi:serine protease Do
MSFQLKTRCFAHLLCLFLFFSPILPRSHAQALLSKTPAEILKENDSALALILSADDDSASLGSGFFIGDGSAVVTNFHVIKGAKKVVIKTGHGDILHASSVYAFDDKEDLAILKVSPPQTRTVKMGDSDKVAIGSSIVVIGNPEGLEKSITNGLVSGVRTVEGQRLFQISAPISHGSSGGPVFNDGGQVIGVVVAFLSDGQNLNFAIPVNNVTSLWSKRNEVALTSLPAGDSHLATQSLDISGAWAATFADSLSAGQLSFNMMQDGETVRGTYTSSLGGGGTISGRVTNNKFTFELVQSVKDCPGHYSGSADLHGGGMFGGYAGNDCQGSHSNGSFSMTKGITPLQPTPAPASAAATASAPIIEYGPASELKGVRTVFIYGVEPDVRNNMIKQFEKHPQLQVVGEIEKADVVLVFGAQFFSMGTHTNVWTDTNGNAWANTSPRYGVTGQGSAVRLKPPNTLRIVWQFSATRTTVFQRRPSTNFVRDFVNAWDKANR